MHGPRTQINFAAVHLGTEDWIGSAFTDDIPNVPDATLSPNRDQSTYCPNSRAPTPDNHNIRGRNSCQDTGNRPEGALQSLEDR
jgi:hypothetical protein